MKAIADIVAKTQWYLVALLAVLTACVWGLNYVSAPVSEDQRPVLIAIEAGASRGDIANRLRKAGLIRSRHGFLITLGLRRDGNSLQPGRYELSPDMGLLRIIDKLIRGEVAASRITIPEGYTVRQIAALLAANGIVDERAFLQAALHGAERFADVILVPSESLEGYLFPDTYYMYPRSSGDAVIREMLTVFRKKAIKPLYAEIVGFSLPNSTPPSGVFRRIHSVVTLGSLIEREARLDGDRALISSVLRNRVGRGMELQVDATVQYALGRHKPRLFFRDYRTPSAYNTYLHKGLPPGPIANPGLKSIEAALRPAKTDYLYYVARPDGSHVFTSTVHDHARAIAAIRQPDGGSTLQ